MAGMIQGRFVFAGDRNYYIRTACAENGCNAQTFRRFVWSSRTTVGPHYPVKREGGLEKASVHRHTVAYANKPRANGHVETILPESGVFGKRPTKSGHHRDPRSETATVSL
jgi:hypothetical protein